jgi:translation initiation factor SUI1
MNKILKLEDLYLHNINEALALEQESEFAEIHVRVKQVRGRKQVTSIAGLNNVKEIKQLLKTLKKGLSCNGSVVVDEKFGVVIRLTGNQQEKVGSYLVDGNVCSRRQIIYH